ncbi:MAG: tetratricopeptide repeat protein [Gemmatimonadota bacterium]
MKQNFLIVALLGTMLWGPPAYASAQEGSAPGLAEADSLYFAGNAEGSLELLTTGGFWREDPAPRRWRSIRALVALGMEPGTTAEQNRWLDQGVALAQEVKDQGPPTLDEIFWGAAAQGRRALNAGPRYAGELGVRARDDARLVLAADPLHGGAHNVLGRVGLEVMSLSRIQRILARATGVTFPGDIDWEEAEHHLRRATELWPHMVLYHLDLAKLLIKRNRQDEARRALQQALATPPLHPPDPVLKEEAGLLLATLDTQDAR